MGKNCIAAIAAVNMQVNVCVSSVLSKQQITMWLVCEPNHLLCEIHSHLVCVACVFLSDLIYAKKCIQMYAFN